MKLLVTGSSGHLGEALVRTLRNTADTVVGADIKPSACTDRVGSITDTEFVRDCVKSADVILHTATLHKPHVATHSKQDFIDTNISGTLALLEAAVDSGVKAFIFTSTTSLFGDALLPSNNAAVWVTEELSAIPKNIYGVTKAAAEDLCHLFHRKYGINCVILRTSRFFPEEDDNAELRTGFADANIKANELLFRRADIQDIVSAHLQATEQAGSIGFGRYIISATSPFKYADLADLYTDAQIVVRRYFPDFETCFSRAGWRMFEQIGRVYVNHAARRDLAWTPKYDFAHVLQCLERGDDFRSPLAIRIGKKRYHDRVFMDGPYPVE